MSKAWLASAEWLKSKGIRNPQIGIVLGTGLHELIKEITIRIEIPYSEIPDFPLSTVESHSGKLVFGELRGKIVLAMAGRFHYYEGYSMDQVVFPIRVMHALGIQTLILSNASGALHPGSKKGELMLIKDHLNFQPEIVSNVEDDKIETKNSVEHYDVEYRNSLKKIAAQQNLILHEGVYASVPGPMLETRAEYRFLRTIGADAVGMSTVPEVVAAHQMKIKTLAVSVLTDECDPDNLHPVTLAEIIAIANEADAKLTRLIAAFIQTL